MKFYQCKECKKVIVTKDSVRIDGWEELIPDSTDAAVEKHVPIVKKTTNGITVCVGSVIHPATDAHYIEWVVVETADGYKMKYFKPTDTPEVTVALLENEEVTGVYAYCNLHGLWKA